MIPELSQVVGLPSASSPVEIGCASEMRFKALFDQASHGDANAQAELVRLRVAYLNWAYASQTG